MPAGSESSEPGQTGEEIDAHHSVCPSGASLLLLKPFRIKRLLRWIPTNSLECPIKHTRKPLDLNMKAAFLGL